jgi:hypothetical protein
VICLLSGTVPLLAPPLGSPGHPFEAAPSIASLMSQRWHVRGDATVICFPSYDVSAR